MILEMHAEDIAWLTAVELTEGVRSGRIDRQAAPRLHLERARRLDPRLAAFVHLDGAARAGDGPLGGASLADEIGRASCRERV